MVSFVQNIQGPADVGIGNQQVVQSDNSYANTMSRAIGGAVDTAIRVTDKVTDDIAEGKAEDIVSDAMAATDQYTKDQEDLNRLSAVENATVEQVARKSALLEKGVKQGKLTREQARLMVSELATAAIEENGFLEGKIRDATRGLLGFDPKSEAVRQFFGAYEEAGSGDGLSALDKQHMQIAESLGMSLAAVKRNWAQSVIAKQNLEFAQSQLELGQIDSDQFIASYVADAQTDTMRGIFATTVQAVKENGSLDKTQFSNIIEQNKQAFIGAAIDKLEASGKYTLDADTKIRDKANVVFSQINTYLEDFDINAMQGRDLERVSNGLTMMGMKFFPQWSALKGGIGERMASQVMDMIHSAGGSEGKLQALMKTDPQVGKFAALMNLPAGEFNKFFFDTAGKFASGDSISSYTPEQAAVLDVVVKNLSQNAKPEERDGLRGLLEEAGFVNKAESILIGEDKIKINRASATPDEVRYIKNQYNIAKEVFPRQIAATLAAEGNNISISADGSINLDMSKTVTGQGGRTIPVRQDESEAYTMVNKLNAFLSSPSWSNDLGIKATTSKELVTQINDMIESVNNSPDIKETTGSGRSKKTETRRPNAEEAMNIISNTSVQLTDREAKIKRREELLRKRALGE